MVDGDVGACECDTGFFGRAGHTGCIPTGENGVPEHLKPFIGNILGKFRMGDKWSIRPERIHFCSMKRLGVFLLPPPLKGMLAHLRVLIPLGVG